MALVYLINKSQVFDTLIRWILLFMEYDFKIVYKLSRSHLMANALIGLPNHIEPIVVPDQTYDVRLFTLQSEWLQNVHEYLLKGMMPKRLTTSQRQYLTQRVKPFELQKGVLYRFRRDNKFHQVLQLE
jgi:hypothetical protein